MMAVTWGPIITRSLDPQYLPCFGGTSLSFYTRIHTKSKRGAKTTNSVAWYFGDRYKGFPLYYVSLLYKQLNPLKMVPEISWVGLCGECVLYKHEAAFNGLKANPALCIASWCLRYLGPGCVENVCYTNIKQPSMG